MEFTLNISAPTEDATAKIAEKLKSLGIKHTVNGKIISVGTKDFSVAEKISKGEQI